MDYKEEMIGLIKEFQAGDTTKFDNIYNKSNRYIYYTILKSVQNKDVAEDILQETYLEIYKNLNSLKEPAAFNGWAATIAQNKICRYFKKNPDIAFSSEEEMDVALGNEEEDDSDLLPEDCMDNTETQRLLGEIINTLPEGHREAIVAFYYNQMSISEIASAMEVPENTVKVYLHRGKKKIKDGVLNLEKVHGTKLYTIPFAVFVSAMFTKEAKACEIPVSGLALVTGATATTTATAATAATATGASAATKVAGTTAAATKLGGLAFSTKMTIAAITGAVVVGGTAGAVVHNINTNKDKQYVEEAAMPEEDIAELNDSEVENVTEEIADEEIVNITEDIIEDNQEADDTENDPKEEEHPEADDMADGDNNQADEPENENQNAIESFDVSSVDEGTSGPIVNYQFNGENKQVELDYTGSVVWEYHMGMGYDYSTGDVDGDEIDEILVNMFIANNTSDGVGEAFVYKINEEGTLEEMVAINDIAKKYDDKDWPICDSIRIEDSKVKFTINTKDQGEPIGNDIAVSYNNGNWE